MATSSLSPYFSPAQLLTHVLPIDNKLFNSCALDFT